MRTVALAGLLLAALSLGACEQKKADDPAPPGGDGGPRASNPAKYDRDIAACRTEVSKYMRQRQVMDDSRTGVFSGERDRYGQGGLPAQMQAYGDQRSSDAMMADCMEAQGWSKPDRRWWQKIGDPHTF